MLERQIGRSRGDQRWSRLVYSSSTLTFCRLKLLLNDHEEVLNVGGVIRHSVVLLIQLDV